MNNAKIVNKNKSKYDYGVIYKCTSNTSEKSYIGQAAEYVSTNVPWGTEGRWKSHIRDAYGQNRCTVLNAAIRKYGSDDFIIETLGRYEYSQLDEMEKMFIAKENTLVPDGYNLLTGGINGKYLNYVKIGNKKSRFGRKHSENTKKHISNGQIGNRRGTKKRKYKEDENLPKYISAKRENGKIVGYNVKSFPIGITKAKYASPKTFMNKKKTLKEKYALAIEHLDNLKTKYSGILTKITNQRKEYEKEKNKDWLEIKKQKMIDKLPEYIYPIYKNKRLRGYYVEFVPTHDGQTYPIKDFNYLSSNHKNRKAAKRYINSLKIQNKDIIFMQNNTKLPKYVAYVKDRNKKIIGYYVNNYPIRNKNGEKFSHIRKKFCSTKETMETKYNKTIVYLKTIRS